MNSQSQAPGVTNQAPSFGEVVHVQVMELQRSVFQPSLKGIEGTGLTHIEIY